MAFITCYHLEHHNGMLRDRRERFSSVSCIVVPALRKRETERERENQVDGGRSMPLTRRGMILLGAKFKRHLVIFRRDFVLLFLVILLVFLVHG